ncbi:MAG TPA: M23 family metallopeptidase [bacterium]|uniref:Murein DD-endopeptidase MepM n=1 Tax=candidate division TA06 bacterium ADurb.Bin417 TaxID=1852828 RepID=A0A1V5MJF8_UNCT6|nr:MAG: Murein DD-endopeptidase MepM [candidate division TA06 bacterium ADurb.Bin417]HNQ35571.1 M23 family metallopeptidase [bacterium]HNS48319.1 M23 family metallopeptidase [bacterium]
MKRSGLIILSGFFWLTLGLTGRLAASEIRIRPERPVGGQGILVELAASDSEIVRVRHQERLYHAYRASSGGREIFLPLRVGAAGSLPVLVERISADSAVEKTDLALEVSARPAESVKISAGGVRMRRRQPSRAEERDLVLDSLRRCSETRRWKEVFIRPLQGKPGTGFGVTRWRGDYQARHWGVDFIAQKGTPVAAVNSGLVVLAEHGYNIYGNLVVVDHGQGVVSAYFHLDRILKKQGDVVERGETIGTVGSTGWSSGPHLHLALYLQGAPVDPLWFIDFTRTLSGAAPGGAKSP